jgi:eukaryotic-like serine/threonine-protein kinase
MALSSGFRLGPYEILAPIGAGGMGEVYKAKDTRLDRNVAIKVLASSVSEDPKLKLRFEREARTISNLSHPNICALHDVGHQQNIDFLVMEYLEGETLANRIAKGPLPLDQVLQYGIQIADALDKAHREKIIHRDLKPQNIMITKSGIKLLDFGLAKWSVSKTATAESQVPTKEHSLTVDGRLVGTLQYMAPEQLEGKEIDERVDIFAFGATLYEMISGQRLFGGTSQASLIASILSTDAKPLTASPPLLDYIVRKCLAKNPDDRWQCAHDLSTQLKWIANSTSQPVVTIQKQKRTSWYERLAWIGVIAALGALLFQYASKRPPEVLPISLSVPPPENTLFDSTISVSPDGRRLAFVATDASGKNQIWIRNLDSLNSRALAGTDGAEYPFWSLDGNSLGFFADGKLKTISISAEESETLCDAPHPSGGTWGKNDVILFSVSAGAGIYRISSKGSTATVVTSPTQSETSYRFPSFLPDHQHFVFYAISNNITESGVYVGSLNFKETHRLVISDSGAIYINGHLIYERAGTLWGQPFDTDHLKITGEAFPISEKPWYNALITGVSAFSAGNDVLAFRSGGVLKTRFVWLDRTGKELEEVAEPGVYFEPSLSPDEKHISLSAMYFQNVTSDIYTLDLLRGTFTRFTFEPEAETTSLWSPDGKYIVYSSFPEGGIYKKLANGTGKAELLTKLDAFGIPEDWSMDGRYISFSQLDFKGYKSDVWILPMDGSRKPFPYLQTKYFENDSQIAPNGKWLAYASDESGRFEVYVQSFPSPGNKVQISTSGGVCSKWRKDGKELFYISPDKKIMSVTINDSPNFEPSVPKALFQTQIVSNIESRNHYVVTADGQRFLVNTLQKEIATAPINVVVNWSATLKK